MSVTLNDHERPIGHFVRYVTEFVALGASYIRLVELKSYTLCNKTVSQRIDFTRNILCFEQIRAF